MITQPLRLLSSTVLAASLAAGMLSSAHADTLGLRISPTWSADTPSGTGGLRFVVNPQSASDNASTTPLLLGIPVNDNSRNGAVWADWYPFGSGLRTSAGLLWRDSLRGANPDSGDNRRRAVFGFGWTSEASSSTSGWRVSADVGASFSSLRDCIGQGSQCSSGNGLKPGSSGDGIRWNPFISIGASFQY